MRFFPWEGFFLAVSITEMEPKDLNDHQCVEEPVWRWKKSRLDKKKKKSVFSFLRKKNERNV